MRPARALVGMGVSAGVAAVVLVVLVVVVGLLGAGFLTAGNAALVVGAGALIAHLAAGVAGGAAGSRWLAGEGSSPPPRWPAVAGPALLFVLVVLVLGVGRSSLLLTVVQLLALIGGSWLGVALGARRGAAAG